MSDTKKVLGRGLTYMANPLAAVEDVAAELAPEMPDQKEPPTAPTTDEATSRRNRMRQQQRRYGGRGRAATALTAQSNRLG